MILASDCPARTRRVSEICSQLEQSLGFSSGWSLPGFCTDRGSVGQPAAGSESTAGRTAGEVRAFLHVSPAKAVIGVLVLERFMTAPNNTRSATECREKPARCDETSLADGHVKQPTWPREIPDGPPTDHRTTLSIRAAGGVSEPEADPAGGTGIEPASGRQAICGVRLLWVSQEHRRRGVATTMLDAARLIWMDIV